MNVLAEKVRLINVGEERASFDPDLPDANAVMAAICCVSARFAANPSLELALLASDLSFKLMAEEYAETPLIADIACHLVKQWDAVVNQYDAMLLAENSTHH